MKIFNVPEFRADAQMAWEVTAMAVSHMGAMGAYRIPVPESQLEVSLAIDGVSAEAGPIEFESARLTARPNTTRRLLP